MGLFTPHFGVGHAFYDFLILIFLLLVVFERFCDSDPGMSAQRQVRR